MRDVVERVSQPGDVILDPFCGAGTTGVAAVGLARKFIGIEMDEAHVKTSRGRLAEATGRK